MEVEIGRRLRCSGVEDDVEAADAELMLDDAEGGRGENMNFNNNTYTDDEE